MADSGWLTVVQKVKVVLFYAETKSVVVTQRWFRAHFGTRWAPYKQIIYRLSLGTIFQPMRINSVPDVKCFFNTKNVLCVQSMVWHFVCHPVLVCAIRYTIKQVWKCLQSYNFGAYTLLLSVDFQFVNIIKKTYSHMHSKFQHTFPHLTQQIIHHLCVLGTNLHLIMINLYSRDELCLCKIGTEAKESYQF